MESLKVQMLKDGDSTVIIINGAEADRDELAWKLLNTYYGLGPSMQDNEEVSKDEKGLFPGMMAVEGLAPLSDEQPLLTGKPDTGHMESYSSFRNRNRVTVSSGRYKGMTPGEALRQDRESALAYFFKMAKGMDKKDPEREEIISVCKQFMSSIGYLRDIYTDRISKTNCIRTLSTMGGLDAVINGYRSVDDFCNLAQDAEVDTAFQNALISFQNRVGNPKQ